MMSIAVPGVTLTGTIALDIDTATGTLQVSGTGVALTVLGQTLTGNIVVTRNNSAAGPVTTVAVSDVSLSFGDMASVTGGSGLLVIAKGGIAGTMSAQLSFGAGSPFDLEGAVSLAVNTFATAQTADVQLAGQDVSLNLPAGPYVELSGTGIIARLAGQKVSGDFTVTQQAGTVHITAKNVTVLLGTTSTELLRLTNGSADVTIGTVTVTNSDQTTSTVSDALVGSVTGTVALVNVPSVTLGGTFSVMFDTTAVSPDPTVTVTGTNVTLGVAGQTLSAASISFSSGAAGVAVSISGGELDFTASGTPLVSADDLNGSFTLVPPHGADTATTADDVAGGVFGEISGKVAVDVPGVSFLGSLMVELNTTGTSQSVVTDSSTTPPTTVDLDPGTVQLSGTGVQLDIAGQTIGGDFTVKVSTASGSTSVLIGVTNMTLTIGSFVHIDSTFGWGGTVLVTSAGVAAHLTGDLTNAANQSIFALPSGITLGGSIALDINTGVAAVDVTTPVTLKEAAGPLFSLSLTNASLSVDSAFTFKGSFAVQRGRRILDDSEQRRRRR